MPKNKTWKISREEESQLTILTCPECGKSIYYDILKTYDRCPCCNTVLSFKQNKEN